MKRLDSLELGPDVVRQLLPHRPPLLLVDNILAWSPHGTPSLRANRHISGSEPVFAGHFPGLSLWPGVFTIEGLGQACNLLYVLLGIHRALARQGLDPVLLDAGLKNAQRGYTLSPAFDPEMGGTLRELLPDQRTRMGMAAHVDVRLLQPVFAGSLLEYRVELTSEVPPFLTCAVEASVGGRTVARGRMISTTAVPPLPAEGEAGG